jgi:hypothetical protein
MPPIKVEIVLANRPRSASFAPACKPVLPPRSSDGPALNTFFAFDLTSPLRAAPPQAPHGLRNVWLRPLGNRPLSAGSMDYRACFASNREGCARVGAELRRPSSASARSPPATAIGATPPAGQSRARSARPILKLVLRDERAGARQWVRPAERVRPCRVALASSRLIHADSAVTPGRMRPDS